MLVVRRAAASAQPSVTTSSKVDPMQRPQRLDPSSAFPPNARPSDTPGKPRCGPACSEEEDKRSNGIGRGLGMRQGVQQRD